MKQAEKFVLRKIQEKDLKENIKNMQTFRGSDGLLRVKSRISNRKDLENFRYPILLPNKNEIVKRLIMERHIELQHAGLQTLISNLREDYWIVKCRRTIRQVIRTCIICKRFSSRPLETVTIPLPEDRVRDAAVFEVAGVDLCGPLFLKDERKSWIVLFTCAIYRAVHLELVSSLTTDCFILALRRFISRRGRPNTIYSDNGKNLIGASNALNTLDWKKITEFSVVKKIEWKFNPPSAPWWGGFWERLIGVLKNVLRRVLGKACLKEEELTTVLCDAESLINSRPLTYLSEDPEDLSALTPAMFLREITESGVPDLDLIDSQKLRKRFIYRVKLRQDLRNRFRNEYLGLLKCYVKSPKESSIVVGDLVLVGDNNVKRINWPLAKVVRTIPGRDGKVRVVEVKTQSGTILRPIQRIYPLEIQYDSELHDVNDKNPVVPSIRHSRYGRLLKTPQSV